jgi:hypothetical protein
MLKIKIISKRATGSFFFLLFGLGGFSQACNVPVFRYALEKWPADPYTIVIYAQAGQGADELLLLQSVAERDNKYANFILEKWNIDIPSGKDAAKRHNINSFPWMEVYFPAQAGTVGLIWSSPLDSTNIEKALHSPLRSALAEKLLNGEVAVWLLLRSGHVDLDQQARHVLQATLQRANSELSIPETGIDSNGNPIAVTDFKNFLVSFSLFEIDRKDAVEEFLISSLLHSENDLPAFEQPLVFPVFGRGRVLYALVGNGINEKNILDACQSMVNWCSCEIKALNPGIDLLIDADWTKPKHGKLVIDQPVSPLVGLSEFIPDSQVENKEQNKSSVVVVTLPIDQNPIPRRTIQTDTSLALSDTLRNMVDPSRSLNRNLLILMGAAVIVLLTASIIVLIKKRD